MPKHDTIQPESQANFPHRTLEIQEGLPEYTGTRLALDRTGEPLSRVADSTTQFEERPTYARALGYGTGPLLGLLLDRYAEDWRTRLPVDSMASQLNRAFGFELPAGSAEAVAARAEPYGGEALAHEEDARAEARRSLLADYQVRLVDGPVLVLGAEQLFRGFDPNSLVPLEGSGTVYPTGSFRGPWGRLTVEAGGALVSHDNRTVQVPRPGDFDPSQRVIEGAGWHLELESDWRFEPGPREGDAKVVAITP